MQEGEPSFFCIDDILSTRYTNFLTGRFVSESKIAVYASKPVTSSTRDQPSENAGKDAINIYMLQPEFIFHEPMLRSFLAETNSTFLALQALGRNASIAEYTKISRTYRSIVRACLEKLQEAAAIVEMKESTGAIDEGNSVLYHQHISIFYSIECIWHLSEILYMEQMPGSLVVPQLLEWIRFHFPKSERMATDLLLLGREATESDNYWPALKGLIMQGQIEVVRAILQLHPAAESPEFQMAEQILNSLPMVNIYNGFNIQKFRLQWQYWVTDTERKLSSNALSVEPNLEELIQLATGDIEAWNTQIAESHFWYEHFPGFLFYTNPACKHFELGSAASTWINRWARLRGYEKEVNFKHLDRVILSLLENNMHEVLHAIQSLGDNQWFVTHLVDLLCNCGKLQLIGDQKVNEAEKMRSSLIYDFGANLMTRNSLWQLGMDYFDYCGKEGRAAQQLLLSKIPLKTEKLALRIIGIAQRKGFTKTAEDICKIQAKKSMDDGRYGNGLEWAVRSNDTILITSFSDFILNHYSKTGDMLCPDVIANIGAKMFLSPRLVFLIKYFDFYQYYRKRDFLPAAELLVNLLGSKITPEYFWPSLLIDAIPLLESKDPKILSKETCLILQHLETEFVPLIEKKKKRLEKFPNEPVNILKDYRIENIEEIINLLRLASARNLSRAIIIENTSIE